MSWVQDIAQDVRFSLRLFANERWFSLAAIGALALAIGVTSMMFTIINGYNLRGLPVDDPERLLYLGTRDAASRQSGVSYPDYQDWRASRSFAALEAFASGTMTISEPGSSPDSLGGAFVSSGAFAILDEKPLLGRGFVESDDEIGAPPVVVLGHRLWVSRYAGDPLMIGRSVFVNGETATVVGVMKEGFEFPFREALWQPLSQLKGIAKPRRDDRVLGVFGRLADGVTPAQARADLGGIVAGLRKAHPDTNAGIELVAVRFGEQQVGRLGDQQPPLALAATAGFVLLIACANVANLLLARAAGRSREMAIRASVGATRWRIVRQLLVESLLLAFASGALGLWLSRLGVGYITAAFGRNVPYWMQFTVDVRVLAFLVAVCFLCALVFGLAPALAASKTDVGGVMKEGGRTGIAPRARRWTQSLVAAELALTLILLGGAGLMVRSFLALYSADRLIDASRVLTMGVELPAPRYSNPAQRAAFYQRLDERLGAIPGLSLATVASNRPFVGAQARQLSIDGQQALNGVKPPTVSTIAIGPRYFEVLGLGVLRGRPFTSVDGSQGHETAIVNQRFAEIHFPDADPVGQRVRLAAEGTPLTATPWLTIVGLSPTIRQSIASVARPVVYVPLRSHATANAAIIVGGLSEPASVTPLLRREVALLDANVTLFNVRPLSELLADTRLQPRLLGTVLGLFAAIALLLSAVGLYSVTAYAVVQRTHEIGVRMALGAQSRQVVWLFVRRALVPLGIGLTIGLAGAFAAGQILRGLLIQTSSTDPVTLVLVVSLLVVVAVAACFFPARRAARLSPLVVLRYE
jgi:putative ABC transport system permease protein